MRLWLRVAGVEDLLADVLREQLIQRVVDRQRQPLAARAQPCGQQRVQVVRGHHVVLASARWVTSIMTLRTHHFDSFDGS